MADKIVTGPVQVFVIGFEKPDFNGRILAELKKARKRGVIRLVDLLFVQKDAGGSISSTMHMTGLSEAERLRLLQQLSGSSPSRRSPDVMVITNERDVSEYE